MRITRNSNAKMAVITARVLNVGRSSRKLPIRMRRRNGRAEGGGWLCPPGGAPLDLPPALAINRCLHGGAVAQLGERLVRNEEVSGSIPLSSTTLCSSVRWMG